MKAAITGAELRFRLAGADPGTAWTYRRFQPNEPIAFKALSGEPYDIELRYLAAVPSPWRVLTHTVTATTRQGVRALPPGSAGNVGSRWVDGATVTWSATDTLADIDVSAGDLQVGDDPVSYSSSSVQVSGTASAVKIVHLYYDDPKWEGGLRALGYTEDLTETVRYGRILVARDLEITFDVGGGSGTGGGGSIGGSGGGSGGSIQ